MRQSPANKPLPEITDATRPFWTAAREGKLLVQECSDCQTRDFPPKPWCVECGSRRLSWVEAIGTGEVYAHTAATAVMMNLPGWQAELPLILCLIDLEDGGRMYGQLTGCKPEEVTIGMRVKVYFEPISEEAGVPKFRPA